MVHEKAPSLGMSLAQRSIVAILLTAGYYLLLVSIVIALLSLPIFFFGLTLGIKGIGVFILLSFGFVIWLLLPQPAPPAAPGLRLQESSDPHFFAEIKRVAYVTKQPMPDEIYIGAQFNAAVYAYRAKANRRTTRVLMIGLPLLYMVTIGELRSIIAHEFGHFSGGDTLLGGWIYRMRIAIRQAIERLSTYGWLAMPFEWYGLLFLRVTQSISRYQEFAADAFAVRVVGRQATQSALRKIGCVGATFHHYLQTEFAPVRESGVMPPLLEGFAYFLSAAPTKALINTLVQQQMDLRTVAHEYDSHPTLRERLVAIDAQLTTAPPLFYDGQLDTKPAVSLLPHVQPMERALYHDLYRPKDDPLPQFIRWEKVGNSVYAPLWLTETQRYHRLFDHKTVLDLPEFIAKPQIILNHIQSDSGVVPRNPKDMELFVIRVLGQVLAVAVVYGAKWQLIAFPGAEILLRAPDGQQLTIQPFSLVKQLIQGELSLADWALQCNNLGLAALPLFVFAAEVTDAAT